MTDDAPPRPDLGTSDFTSNIGPYVVEIADASPEDMPWLTRIVVYGMGDGPIYYVHDGPVVDDARVDALTARIARLETGTAILQAAAETLVQERDDYRERFNYEAVLAEELEQRIARLEAAGALLRAALLSWYDDPPERMSDQDRDALAAWRVATGGSNHD